MMASRESPISLVALGLSDALDDEASRGQRTQQL